ncbi:unnamed protein product [Sphacelaria rigidula]
MKELPTAMGHRRLTLLAMAVAALLAVDCAVAASKGASRGSSHRRVSSVASGHPRRTNKDTKDEDWESREHAITAGTARRSSRSKPDRNPENKGPTSDRRRVRPSSSSPSRSRYPNSSKNSSRERRGHSRGHGMELVPSRRGQPKPSMLSGIAATVKGRAAAMQEDAKGKMTEWRNIAKTTVWFSSTMEKAMIQMTWPDDNVLDDIWVKDTMRFLEGIGSEPPRSPKNHRKRILRKLWLRMTEQDYRTKLKALQILHHMSMDLTPEANVRVRNQFLRMRDETNHKNRNEVYFEQSRIMDVSSSGIPFLPLLRSYGSFAFARMTEVQGGPQQLASALYGKKTSQAEAVAALRRLDKLICRGTRCKVDRKTMNTITGQVANLVARDVMGLWRLYVKGLKRLVKGRYKEGKMAGPETLIQLLKQYSKTLEMVQLYLSQHKNVVRDRSMFDDNQVDPEALRVFLVSVASEDTSSADEEDDHDEEVLLRSLRLCTSKSAFQQRVLFMY